MRDEEDWDWWIRKYFEGDNHQIRYQYHRLTESTWVEIAHVICILLQLEGDCRMEWTDAIVPTKLDRNCTHPFTQWAPTLFWGAKEPQVMTKQRQLCNHKTCWRISLSPVTPGQRSLLSIKKYFWLVFWARQRHCER